MCRQEGIGPGDVLALEVVDVEEVARRVDEMREVSDRWLIAWDGGREAVTGMVGLAWYAREFDDEATVTPLS